MHIEIDDNMNIKNLQELSKYIPICSDIQILISLSNELLIHIINKDIIAQDASSLFFLIKNQINTLNNSANISNEKGKRYTINPVGRPTYLQSREGIINLSLLIINIIVIAIMYVFLYIGLVIR